MSALPPDPQPPTPGLPGGFLPPVSAFSGPIAELVGHGLLSPPNRPGLLASLDRFEILRVLGGGGMGVVLLARETATGAEVAVKMVRPELAADQQVARRFVREAGHLQKLQHPNIVPVREVSDREAAPYFVMPYFAAGSLARRIVPGKPLAADQVREIASQVCAGLQFAHRRGIIHRDLKPANVLCGAEGKVCLADFGLARSMFNDSILEVDGSQCEGTAPYMSPGVAAGNAEDTRCDIYAFGALVYEMLTGEAPYQGRTTKEIREQIVAGPPRPITDLNPAADPRLVMLVEGAMGRQLRERYADMADVAADLQRIGEGRDPVGPHGLGRNVREKLLWMRRIPILLWGFGILAVGALIATLFWPKHSPHPGSPAPPANLASAISNSGTSVAVAGGTNSRPPVLATNPAPSLTNRVPVVGPAVSAVATNPVTEPPPNVATQAPPTPLIGPLPLSSSVVLRTNFTFQSPWGVAADRFGNVYVTDKDQGTLTMITPAGTTLVLAGNAGWRGTTNGIGGSARLAIPRGTAVDRSGMIYIAEPFNIRKVSTTGVVTNLAGMDGYPGGDDGAGVNARFSLPSGLAVDGAGNIYVADRYAIRKVSRSGLVTTLAGSTNCAGKLDGNGTEARFSDKEKWLTVDSAGNVYVADTFNNLIRKISAFGVVTTLAGDIEAGNGDGKGAAARFNHPGGITVDESGNLFVSDTRNQTIRKITPAGEVTTVAGNTGVAGWADGPAATAQFNQPQGLALDGQGNLYIADNGNQVVRKVSASGQVSTIAGRPPVGPGGGGGKSAN